MADQLTVVAAVYTDRENAELIRDTLQKMHKAANINLTDLALVTRDADGKVNIDESREVTGRKGAKRGAIVAGVFGILFPPSLIASALAGGAVGAAYGKLRDTGVKTGDLQEIADSLQPGNIAVVALTDDASMADVRRVFEATEGKLVTHEFSSDDSAQIEAAAAESTEGQA